MDVTTAPGLGSTPTTSAPGLRFGHTTVMIPNICIRLCAVQGLLLSSEVIKRGFEQGSQEQVGNMKQVACTMQHVRYATGTVQHATGNSTCRLRRLPRVVRLVHIHALRRAGAPRRTAASACVCGAACSADALQRRFIGSRASRLWRGHVRATRVQCVATEIFGGNYTAAENSTDYHKCVGTGTHRCARLRHSARL